MNFKAEDLIEQMPTGIVLIDRGFIIRYISQLAEGYTQEDVIGKSCFDWVDEEEARKLKQFYSTVFDTKISAEHEVYVQENNEVKVWTLIRAAPFNSQDDKEYLIVTYVNIHSKKIEHEAIRQSEKRFRKFFESSTDCIISFDDEGVIDYVNPSLEPLFGYDPEKILGESIDIFMLPEDLKKRKQSKKFFFGLNHKSIGKGRDVVAKHLNGKVVPIHLSLNDYYIDGQKRWTAVIRDMSELHMLRAGTEHNVNLLSQGKIITVDEKFIEVIAMANKVSGKNIHALILGESGVGKELLSELLHHQHTEKDTGLPFIKLNCNTFSDELFESQLFGHVKGAFTGANEEKMGVLEVVKDGTVFLDEIGDLSDRAQGKLLRVIETGEFNKLGSTKLKKAECRLIAATNRDLLKLIAEGRFRLDLYHRLNGIELKIPPLRERKQDIVVLTNYFLNRFNLQYNKDKSITSEALTVLMDYSWPGNVRELLYLIQKLVVIVDEKVLNPKHITKFLKIVDKNVEGFVDINENSVSQNIQGQSCFGVAKNSVIEKFEKEYIRKLLNESGGNVSRAARIAEMNRKSLIDKMSKYKIVARGNN